MRIRASKKVIKCVVTHDIYKSRIIYMSRSSVCTVHATALCMVTKHIIDAITATLRWARILDKCPYSID